MHDTKASDSSAICWPNGHDFAFTIFDDTDWTTLENGPAVYELITRLGFRITKSVWPLATTHPRTTGGETCASPRYLEWVLSLQGAGHEIGYHNATDHPSYRAETAEALDTFRELFGHYPKVGADHAGNREALYWGPRRLTGWRSTAYSLTEKFLQPQRPKFSGDDPRSAYFWGDLCRDKITYWRSFSFSTTNTLRVCPEMPYHDPDRPFVNYYFAASHAPRRESFLNLISTKNLDQLQAQRGACIVYTHLGVDFVENGVLDPAFVSAMTRLSRRNGWFVPVSVVLDELRSRGADRVIGRGKRNRLENRWLVDKVRHTRRFGPSVVTTGSGPR